MARRLLIEVVLLRLWPTVVVILMLVGLCWVVKVGNVCIRGRMVRSRSMAIEHLAIVVERVNAWAMMVILCFLMIGGLSSQRVLNRVLHDSWDMDRVTNVVAMGHQCRVMHVTSELFF